MEGTKVNTEMPDNISVVEECAEGRNQSTQLCTNTHGGYTCTCHPEFSRPDNGWNALVRQISCIELKLDLYICSYKRHRKQKFFNTIKTYNLKSKNLNEIRETYVCILVVVRVFLLSP